jgi:hypothetical protein
VSGTLAVTTTAVWGAPAAVISGQGMFTAPFMRSVAYIAMLVVRLVGLEVVEGLSPAPRQRPPVAVMRVITVINVAVEAAMTVKPGAGSNEDSTSEPVWPIVAIGGTVVRSVVKIAVRANGRNANIDGDLRRSHGGTA